MFNDKPLETVANRYSLVKLLGKGGMGSVYSVEDLVHKRQKIALKMIDTRILSPESLQRFKREFEIMTRLKHPNLIRVYDLGYDTEIETYYITMEYLDGLSVQESIEKYGAFDTDKAISILVDMCRALEFIHSRGILHRDINPRNIIASNGQTKLMDFGLADSGEGDRKTKGTIAYMAPEIFKGDMDCRTDIYALGCTFYEILTGSLFYANDNAQQIILSLRNQEIFTAHTLGMLDRIENPELVSILKKMIIIFLS